MKKILVNFFIILLSLFCLTACGGIKKDPEVVKYIVDRINNDINVAISEKEIGMTTLRQREAELAKNIKVEVTDVISSKEYIEIYLKNLEERNKRLEEGGMFSKANIIKAPSDEVIEEFKKNSDVVYYKYIITADIVNLDDILKELHPKMKELMAQKEIHEYLMSFLSEENKNNLKYETVENYGYFRYDTKTGECDYASAFTGLSIMDNGITKKLNVLPFLSARGHDKYNSWTAYQQY